MERGPVFGLNIGVLLANYDQSSQSWKTSVLSLFEDLTECLDRLPKSGMMQNGKIFEQATWAHRTAERESGLLHIPTPTVMDSMMSGKYSRTLTKTEPTRGVSLAHYVESDKKAAKDKWPTPDASMGLRGVQKEWKPIRKSGHTASYTINQAVADIEESTIGRLNPQWVDWLMGYPTGWTDLKDLEIQLSLK